MADNRSFHLIALLSCMWGASIIIFTLLTRLDRSKGLFVQLLPLPVVTYLLCIYAMHRYELAWSVWVKRLTYGIAILCRVIVLFIPIGMSDDIYRYVWDGQVQHHGINPYLYAPNASQLLAIRQSWWPLINHPSISTPYPPTSQLFFWMVTLLPTDINGTILAFRIILLGVELAVLYVLSKLLHQLSIHPKYNLIVAWSPLAIFEIAGNAHGDILAILLCLLAVWSYLNRDRHPALLPVAITLAFLTKIYPIFIIPFTLHVWRKRDYLYALLTAAITILPYYKPGIDPVVPVGQMTFIKYFAFNNGLFRLFYALPVFGYDPAVSARTYYMDLLLPIAIYTYVRFYRSGFADEQFFSSITMLLLLALLLGPDVQPWYLLWVLPLATIALEPTTIVASVMVLFSYEIYPRYDTLGIWQENGWIVLFEYTIIYGTLLLSWLYNRRRLRQGMRS